MPIRSLVDLASAACIKNIRILDSVGDYLPYENVRHILARVENAHQLRRIELNSPQVEGRTGEIWLKLIERDFPLEFKSKAYKPQNPAKWFRVWERYKKDHDRAVEESVKQFQSAFAGLVQDREKNTSKIVEGHLLPTKGRIKRRRGGSQASDRLAFTSGSKTKTLNGAGVMRKVRREVKEIKSIHGSLSRSTDAVNKAQGLARVQHAPKGMINEHRIAAQPAALPPMKASTTAAAPKKSSIVKEFEARATFISDSEDDFDDHGGNDYDDDDEGDGDNLFDEPKRAPAPRRPEPEARPRASISGTSRTPVKSAPAPSRSPTKADTAPKPTAVSKVKPTTASPVKTGLAGRMAQKFGNPRIVKKAKPASEASRPAAAASSSSPVKKAEREPSPPPRASSPPAPDPKPALAPARKRKAVDVFMRPKKRLP